MKVNSTVMLSDMQALYGFGLQPARHAPANNINNINNPPVQPSPRKYNDVLADILRNVDPQAWSTVSGENVGKLLSQVLKKVDKSMRTSVSAVFKDLKMKADGIQEKFAVLSHCKAGALARALKHCWDYDNRKPGQSVDKPWPMERKMASCFESIVQSLYELSGDLRDLAMGEGLPADLRSRVNDMVLALDSRASEMHTLGLHLAAMADEMQAGGGAGPYQELLGENGRTVFDLAKGMGGIMHGNYDSVERLATDVTAACESLGRLTARIKTDVMKGADIAGIQADLDRADRQINALTGPRAGELARSMDPRTLRLLQEKIGRMRKNLALCHETAALAARVQFVNAFSNPFAGIRKDTLNRCPELKKLYLAHKAFIVALRDYARHKRLPAKFSPLDKAIKNYAGLLDGQKGLDLLLKLKKEELGDLRKRGLLSNDEKKLLEALEDTGRNLEGKDRDVQERLLFKRFHRIFLGVPFRSASSALAEFRKQLEAIGAKRGTGVFRADDVTKVIAGRGVLSGLLLASLYDVDEKWIKTDLDDGQPPQETFLGSGIANSVVKLTYGGRNEGDPPTEIAFKPGVLADIGAMPLFLYEDGYVGQQQMLKLNIASQIIAEKLGCGDRVTKSVAMFHKGKFGIGMDFAKGSHPGDALGDSTRKLSDWLKYPANQNHEYGPGLLCELVRQTIDLQWLDLLSGQGDRHGNNYKVWIDYEGKKVAVTGIDNDMCMPKYRTGLTKIKLAPERLAKVKKELTRLVRKFIAQFGGRSAKTVVNDIMRKYVRDGVVDFDRSRFVPPDPLPPVLVEALHNVLGVKSLCVPKVMSKGMYDELLKIAADATGVRKDEFVREIAALLPAPNVAAFRQRLEDLLALVRSGRIRVVSDGTDWLTGDVYDLVCKPSETYEIPDRPVNDEYKNVLISANKRVSTLAMRDFSNLLNGEKLENA